MKAKDIMTTTCVVVSPDNSVRHAADLMLRCDVSGLPVVDDDGMVVGMLTEGDLLNRSELGCFHSDEQPEEGNRASRFIKSWSWKVADVMSKDPLVVSEDTSIIEVATLLKARGYKRVPVVRDRRLIGVVSRRDLLRVICSASRERGARTAEAVARIIRARLQYDLGIPDNNVTVGVEQNTVRLTGTARSEAELAAIRAVIDNIESSVGIKFEISGPSLPA